MICLIFLPSEKFSATMSYLNSTIKQVYCLSNTAIVYSYFIKIDRAVSQEFGNKYYDMKILYIRSYFGRIRFALPQKMGQVKKYTTPDNFRQKSNFR